MSREDLSEKSLNIDEGFMYDLSSGGLVIIGKPKNPFGDEVRHLLAGVKLLAIFEAHKEGKGVKEIMRKKLEKMRDEAGENQDHESFMGFQNFLNRLSIED